MFRRWTMQSNCKIVFFLPNSSRSVLSYRLVFCSAARCFSLLQLVLQRVLMTSLVRNTLPQGSRASPVMSPMTCNHITGASSSLRVQPPDKQGEHVKVPHNYISKAACNHLHVYRQHAVLNLPAWCTFVIACCSWRRSGSGTEMVLLLWPCREGKESMPDRRSVQCFSFFRLRYKASAMGSCMQLDRIIWSTWLWGLAGYRCFSALLTEGVEAPSRPLLVHVFRGPFLLQTPRREVPGMGAKHSPPSCSICA